jgi:structural maintenance of chromosome 3 (chondroitin sulfate proteoglycan 6)
MFVSIDMSFTPKTQVSFNSKAHEGLRIQQLSGGQKSLVALATGEHAQNGQREAS